METRPMPLWGKILIFVAGLVIGLLTAPYLRALLGY